MPVPDTAKPRPLITPVGILLLTVFCAAMVGVALSTQPVIKRLDAPPPGTVLVFSGTETPARVAMVCALWPTIFALSAPLMRMVLRTFSISSGLSR